MSRRYTTAEKEAILLRLDQNGGDVPFTAYQLNVPERTLERWKSERTPPPPAPQHAKIPPQAPQSATNPVDLARIHRLLDQLMDSATRLADSITNDMEDAPIGQRATALNRILTTVVRLSSLLPPDQQEQKEFPIVFVDEKTGRVSLSPFAPEEGAGE